MNGLLGFNYLAYVTRFYSFYGNMAEVLADDLSPYLPYIIPHILVGLQTTDGIEVQSENKFSTILEGNIDDPEETNPDLLSESYSVN